MADNFCFDGDHEQPQQRDHHNNNPHRYHQQQYYNHEEYKDQDETGSNSETLSAQSTFSGRNNSATAASGNFHFQQIPIRRGSRNTQATGISFGGNHQSTFLDRFRSQTNIAVGSPSKSGRVRNGNSRSVLTSPVNDPTSPSSTSNGYTNKGNKPRKWFSFTNLLNRQHLTSLLSLPRSRLSVSSTLNSVFMGPSSPVYGEGGIDSHSISGITNNFFDGSRGFADSSAGGCGPASPTPSCATISGEYPSRSIHSNSSNSASSNLPASSSSVIFRRKSGGCSSSNKNSTSNFSTGRHNLTGVSSVGSSRLSCGEFFTGTPNSPIYSFSGTSTDYSAPFHHFQFHPTTSSTQNNGCSKDAVTRKALGRSLPTLLEAMETATNPQGSPDCGSKPVTVESVVDLLYQEFAILTGAKSIDDHYIIVFPDRGNFQLLGDEEYRRLMVYLTSVPPMQDAESGFVLVIDRRGDKWNSVKTTLLKISSYFPGLIHRVFVLRPVGFIQKALSEVSTKLFRTESLRFRLTVCNHVSDLGAFIESSQLTSDLGGSLHYDKVRWVQQRVEVEAFCIALQALSKELKSFTESFHDLEYPNDVISIEELIHDKESDFERLKLDLSQAGDHGENLLKRIKLKSSTSSGPPMSPTHEKQSKEKKSPTKSNSHSKSNGNGHSNGRSNNTGTTGSNHSTRSTNSVQLINVISVERFIIQIEETSRLFSEFWGKEKSGLEHCLRLRMFEQDFRELQSSFDSNLSVLNGINEMGENLISTVALLETTLKFEEECASDLKRANQLELFGREIVATNPSAVDSVEPKCVELSRMASHFRFVLEEKILKQKEWKIVQSTVEKANLLCTEGMDLTTTSHVSESQEDCIDAGTTLIPKIDLFIQRVQPVIDELIKLKGDSTANANSQSKTLVKQIHRLPITLRVEDVQLMCAKRRSLIVQQMVKAKSRRSSGSSLRSTGSSGSGITSLSNNTTSSFNELKSAKSTSQLNYAGEGCGKYCGEDCGTSLKSGSSTLSLDGHSNGKNCEELSEIKKVKRGHVLRELIQTEKSYVEEIGDILSDYRDQALSPDAKSFLPTQLQPTMTKTGTRPSTNVSVLFCNLDEIFAFHSKIFLTDLANCIQSIELVGLCFIQRHSDFLHMYSQYCQLLPASESLRKQIGEDHPWFVSCRNRIGHKLPLGAYLLKPVQRITKYHLLLKDLVKNSEGCNGFPEILEALECMLVVLRCVNDGMHQLSITGYPTKLHEEGPLLLQGPFLLWTETKKDRLRLKGHQRHLFLYQKSILITKKCAKTSSYEFRNKLNLSEIGLTEALKGSAASKKFEIWANGRQKVFLLQAETQDMKDMWVMEIKKLLLEQLESLRATKSGSSFANIVPNTTVISGINSTTCNSSSKRHQMLRHKGATMNGWRSSSASSIGGHRPLRQVSSWENADSRRSKSRLGESGELGGDEEPWSSDVTNSDEEESVSSTALSSTGSSYPTSSISNNPINVYGAGENVTNCLKFVALADYSAMSIAEISLTEGDVVSLVKVGSAGWWFVKLISCPKGLPTMEGWTPSAYLERLDRSNKHHQILTSTSSSSSDLIGESAGGSSSGFSNNKSSMAMKHPSYARSNSKSRISSSPVDVLGGFPSQHSHSTEDLISSLR